MREGENLDIEDREHIHVPTCIWCFFLKWDKHTDSNNNLKYLHDLIKDNEKLKILERKVDFNDDKRHWRKKYNEGIYLHSKIENAEKDAGLINIKDKK